MDIGFIIKKAVTFFVEPLGFILLLSIIGLYFLFKNKIKHAKVFIILSVSILFILSYPPFSNVLVENLESKYEKYQYKNEVKYIHVLGSGHNTDIAQPISSNISDSGIKRVVEGVIVHKKTPYSKIIFTGYEGNTDKENAKMNAKLAESLGVLKENLIVNGSPKDTYEEALFTKKIVNDQEFILVTSATHMHRAMMIFKSLGMRPIPAPTDFEKEKYRGPLREPNLHSLYNSKKAIHEYIGILWTILRS